MSVMPLFPTEATSDESFLLLKARARRRRALLSVGREPLVSRRERLLIERVPFRHQSAPVRLFLRDGV